MLFQSGWMWLPRIPKILPFGFCGCPKSRFCSCLCCPVLGKGKEIAYRSLLPMKGAESTIAKCSLWAFPIAREKTVCFLYLKHMQHEQCSCSRPSRPSLVSPCHLKSSVRLKWAGDRDVAVGIPTGGVSSSASSDSRKREHRLFNYLFNGLYECILGPVTFFTASCPWRLYCKCSVNAANPSAGLGVSPGAASPAKGESWCLPSTYFCNLCV